MGKFSGGERRAVTISNVPARGWAVMSALCYKGRLEPCHILRPTALSWSQYLAEPTMFAYCCSRRLDTPHPAVLRETKWSEGTMQELAAAGAPSSVSGYEDADAATAVFSAIAPQCLKKFELHELQLPVGDSSGASAAAAAADGVDKSS